MADRDGDSRQTFRAALAVASIGIEMAVAVIVGWFVGDWLDDRLSTGPVMMYLFTGCGVAAGMLSLWRTTRKYWPR
jgi:F0F1-type ATP synthase assembly protein I